MDEHFKPCERLQLSETLQLTETARSAGIFCRVQGAGCRLKFNYNWKTAGTKNN